MFSGFFGGFGVFGVFRGFRGLGFRGLGSRGRAITLGYVDQSKVVTAEDHGRDSRDPFEGRSLEQPTLIQHLGAARTPKNLLFLKA